MKYLFDYIYYRFYKAFFKWDGEDGHRAILAVTLAQVLIIAVILLAIFVFFWGRAILFPYSKLIGMSGVALVFILMFVNGKVYDGKFSEFDNRWRDESEDKRILKGLMILIVIILPFIALFIISRQK